MASQTNNRNGGMLVTRNERSMPKWVTEQSDRIGPKPPPPPVTPENGDILPKQPSLPPKTKTLPEPDYEVIEFSNQQYSNAPLRPNSASSGSKTPDNKLKCTLCGSGNPWVTCDECAQQIFCASCDDMFHKHPKRKNHQRKTIEKSLPPLPPKILPGQTGPSPPVAPPRRNKRGLMTPLMQRKDQGNSMPGPFPVPSSPTPSQRNGAWQDRFGSLPRGLNLLNRPLPDTPKTPPSESSRSTTPKSVFDNIQRPPSITLEKIKSKANATLDRMQLLQQRYRQQKEQLERERTGSVTDQNMSAFDQWSSISQSPSHFHSGSMSSGINSSHLDLMDDNNFNFVHQRQLAKQHHHLAAQRANQLGQRALSTSVFNLNHINRNQPPTTNGWMNSSMQQAQSMAQLNCANCAHQQSQWNGHSHMHMPQDPWCNQLASQQHLNRSNMSLNVSAGYMMQPQMNGMYPPPTFMNQRGIMQQMYPQPYMGGMPVMNPGLMGMPPSASRAASRAGSRMASPAMSRKSVTLRRKQRSNYIDDEATDDEDSDEDDRRSITSNRSGVARSRQRRLSSASQIHLDEDIDSPPGKLHRHRARNQRRDSIAKSVHNDWAPGRRGSNSNNNNRSADSGFNSPLKPSRIYSDLDSEGSGTRALVQAKIEQKLKEESLKQKQTKTKRQSQSPTPQKTSAAVQTPAVKKASKQENKEDTSEAVVANEPNKEEKQTSKIEAKDEEIKQKYQDKQASASEEEEETESEEEEDEDEDEDEESASEPNSLEPDLQADNNNEAVVDDTQIEEDDLGPPPSTPDHEWECEFCTFVNEANIKICSICCKTPSIKPKKAIKNTSPPKQIKAIPTETKEKGIRKDKDKSATIKKRPTTTTGTATATSNSQTASNHIIEKNTESTNSINQKSPLTTKTDSAHSTDEAYDSSSNTFKTKESVEDVWATLDENIQATANEVTRKAETKKTPKDSTACDSLPNSKSASVEPQNNDSSKFQAREIGTSPPPQSISTQTYDTLTINKPEAKEDTISKSQTSQSMFNDAIQPTSFPPSPKIQDLKSFEAEVLNKIHNISHVPSHLHHHHHHQQQQQQQQLHNYHANHNSAHYFNDSRQRYRSNNDLHMDDAMSMEFEGPFNGLGRRQPSISELMLLQKVSTTSSQMHSPLGGSIYDLPYRDLSSLRLTDMDNHKESDLYKYTTEELNAALKYCGPDMHPLVWLRDNWPKLIQTVQSLATKYGQERAENTIGTISQMEAREALRLHTGNIWQAVSECIEQRQRKYREISSKGNFSREDIVTALTTHQGNIELALHDLGRNQLKPFLMRIWGSPGGVENESGTQPLSAGVSQTSQLTAFNIDKDIHSFLSVNASDCMQTPNDSGAFHNNNNQMPSPFDRPVPFATSFDNNNHMLDNTSSYSADSKDFATTSPLPIIDESVLNNKNVLKDLENLIGNMEQNQQKPNDHVLRSIHDMISNMNPKTDNDYDPETMRILTKSPITPSKYKTSPKESQTENEADVKNFVWQHIQEIVPNLVQQVEMELMEDIEEKLKANKPLEDKREITPDTSKPITAPPPPPPPPPIDQDEFLMEEVIKPNIKNASIKEELPPQFRYPAEIATFQMAFDKCLQREHEQEFEFDSLEEAQRNVYKMFKAPQVEETAQVFNTRADSREVQGKIIDSAESQTVATESKIQTYPLDVVNGATSTTQDSAEPQTTISFDTLSRPGQSKDTIFVENQHLNETISETESSDPSENHQVQVKEETNNRSIEIIPEPMETEANEINVPVLDTKPFADIQSTTVTVAGAQSSSKVTDIQTTFGTVDEAQSSLTVTDINITGPMLKVLSHEVITAENVNFSSQEQSPSKDSNNSIKNFNLYKRTTVQDLSEALDTAETIATNSNMEHSDLVTPLVINTPRAELQSEGSITAGDVKPELETPSTLSVAVDTLQTTKVEFKASQEQPASSQSSIQSQHNVAEDAPTKPSSLQGNSTEKESKLPGIVKSTSFAQKRVSKIPVRRTASNQSLIISPIVPSKAESKGELVQTVSSPVDIPQTSNQTEDSKNIVTDDESDEELYSIASDSTAAEPISRADEFQSPVSTNEMILMIQQEESENTSTIAPSTSSSTLHSTTSQASGLKSPPDFIPSSDPSKQNLSELVEDTQRLIKQMKDEISIDDFESSTDEYTDEYSDEYDDSEEEDEDDEDWEGEEEESEEDDDDEYDDITEDITEENEDNNYSSTQSPLPFSQESQNAYITSDLANIRITESFDHSQALLSDHFEQDNTQNQTIFVEENVAIIETENSSPELPVETVIDTILEQPQNSVELNESENLLPETPVEAVLETVEEKQEQINEQHESEDTTALVSSLQNILSAPLSIDHPLETENALPELPVELTIAGPVLTVAEVLNEDTRRDKTENSILQSNVSNPSAANELDDTSKPIPQENQNSSKIIMLNENNLSSNRLDTEATEMVERAETLSNNNQQNEAEMPSTSKQVKETTIDKKTTEKSQQFNKDKQTTAIADTKNKYSGDVKITTKKPLAASKIPKPKEAPKDQKPKVSAATKPQNEYKKKLYTRSKSFSGPPTPIGIASVKTISQKFLNPPQNTNQTNAVKKPQPVVARRSSIVETINKFTKPSNELEKHVTTSSLFKTRTQPRIPKKKYHETCFSDDDYETTSSEEELEPLEIRQRKLSIPVFRAYPSVQQEPIEVNTEELIEKFMKEELTSSIAEAQIAATLVAMKFQQDVSIWAAKECSDLDHAIALLKQECELCSGTYALNEIVSMLKCTHKCCKQCAKTYFTVQITERSINDCSCPFCKLPELHNQTEHEDENLEYFSNLDIFLKNILEPEVHELFQRKLRDRTLLKDPNFKWCVQCSSGFFARPKQKRLICPDCGSVTCAQCRKPWQKQHEGISCDQYAEWESANDPEVQAKGVQQHLEHNGIDCPKCKFRYSLARGGCMHFTCTQCKYEFCYGCAKPFMMGAKCTISPYCAKLGLHAHHPRNCLFYLRDKLPVQLQILLKNNGVTYEVDPIDVPDENSKDDEPSTSKKKELLCSIAIQKETPTGLVDTRCNGDVPDKHAGMCRTHYVEYLTAKVARAKIDPLPIFDLTDCVQELRRRGIPLPERGPWDTDEIYKNMCTEVIQKNIPLDAD
ncbi:hypothetical protein DOY81_004003 [Sarcophaga bullata]|nr:hypothetical protein DOY81_004003 [Sarcophaga bullata]